MDLEVGALIQNKYRIVRLIGQGGMGAVYEGENVAIARRVAIKVLYTAVAAQHGVVERFEREAQAAGRIGNDHILEVLDMGLLPDGNRFMVMEYLDGETLGERTTRVGPMTAKQIAPLARQLLVGLAAAHHAGIIHRDLKPDNVFILREKAGHPDFVKIIDFGISKFTTLDQDMKMTATGAVMGTPYFMSPEQAKGSRSADIRSDLYAVGVIIYKSITGIVPFDGSTFNELLFKIVLSPVPLPRETVPDLDPAFETIIMKAMARDPAFRFQTSEAFIKALDAWMSVGAAVTVPPPEASGYNQSQVIGPPTPAMTQMGNPATMATEAKGTWAQADVAPGAKKGTARWGIAAAAVVALALGGVVVWSQGSDVPEDPAVAGAVSGADLALGTEANLPDVASAVPSSEPVVKPVAAAEASAAADVTAAAEASAAAASAEAANSALEQNAPAPSNGAATTPAADGADAPQNKSIAKPAPRPVAAKPPSAPAPRPPSQPGRPKPPRTSSPDFGY